MAKEATRVKPVIGARFLKRQRADIAKLRQAIDRAEQDVFPDRTELVRIYKDAVLDSHLSAVWELQRKAKVISLGFSISGPDGEEVKQLTEWFKAPWFTTFCGLAMDSKLWGFEVIEFGDIVNGAFSYVRRVPHHLVIPERHELRQMVNQPRGVCYLDEPYNDWYLGIGNEDDLGLLVKAAMHTISKRFVKAAWDEFAMDFGMPTRVVTLDSSADDNQKDEMVTTISDAGRGAVIAINKDEDLKFLQAQSVDAYKVYQEDLGYCNAEISKLIVGQTMTSENGSSRSQAEVHERVTDTLMISDSQWLADVVNIQLMPFLVKHKLVQPGLKFTFDQKQELSLGGMNQVMQTLLSSGQYRIPAEFIERKFGFEVEFKETAAPEGVEGEEVLGKGKAGKAAGGLPEGKQGQVVQASWQPTSKRVYDLYHAGCGHDHGAHSVEASAVTWFDEQQLEDLVKAFYDGQYSEDNLPEWLQKKFYTVLWSGAQRGVETEYVLDSDLVFKEALQRNVAMFSAAKTWQQASELAGLVVNDKGQQREWKSFKEEALKVAKDYNVHYLRTEYDTAVAAGQMAGLWKQMEATVGPEGLVMYDTAGDARVRPEHQKWDRIVRPLSDDFWNTHWPPNGYNCRCTVRFVNDGAVTQDLPEEDDVPAEFRLNAGKMAMIFSPEHPYWEIPADKLEAVSKVLGKSVDDLLNTYQRPTAVSEKSFMKTDLAKRYAKEIREAGGYDRSTVWSRAEQVAIRAYTDKHEVGIPFNAESRASYPEAPSTADYRQLAYVLRKALEKGPKHAGVVVRTISEAEADNYVVGQENTFKQFVSTTAGLTPGMGEERSFRLIITGAAGTYVDKISKVETEREVLFPPGTRIFVEKKYTSGFLTYIYAKVQKDE